MESALVKIEGILLRAIETRGFRVHAFEMFKHLIVAGNVLVCLTPTATRVFPLNQYVVNRDPEGTVLEIVIKESVAPISLPESVRAFVEQARKGETGGSATRTVDVYTYIERKSTTFEIHQEVKGITIPGTEGSYPIEKCPYLALRWTRIDGESYGRGHCEEYLGDLVSFEGLARAILEASAAMAKMTIVVKPGVTDPKDLEKANLSVIVGDKEDIGVVQMEKSADLSVAANTAQTLEDRLKYAFLLNEAVRRDAERVTAQEIRYVAEELETALGGVYSIFAEEFQRPLVKVLLAQGIKDGSIPPLPEKSIHPVIVTGTDAMGRSQQFNRIMNVIGNLAQVVGPEIIMPYIEGSVLLAAGFQAEGVDIPGLVKSPEQVAQERSQAQQQAMVEKGVPNAVKGVADMTLQQAQQQAESQPQGAK
jgi:hypothetical protein